MLAQVMSDLHSQSWELGLGYNYWSTLFPEYSRTDAEILILAGDVVQEGFAPKNVNKTIQRLTEFGSRYQHVIYVPGNHEFDEIGISAGLGVLAYIESRVPGLVVLGPGRMITLGGRRFLGGTMWFPYRDSSICGTIRDHFHIHDYPDMAFNEYRVFEAWLRSELGPGDIVVTHYAPSEQSVAAEWQGNRTNPWYIASEIEPLLLEKKPALWVHGHTHNPFDYKLGDTRVLCNAMGHLGEGISFNPKLVVDLDAI